MKRHLQKLNTQRYFCVEREASVNDYFRRPVR